MKVAIVHDSLTEFGGAERVLQVILELYPDADIYTAFTRDRYPEKYLTKKQRTRLHVSWLQWFPVEHHTSFIQAIAPLVWRRFRFHSYDLVISHSLHIMSSLIHVPNGIHISYIPTPPKNIIGRVPPVPLQRIIPYTRYIRPLYQKALKHIPYIIANSKHTQAVLRTYFNVSSTVIYPPVTIPRHQPKKPNGKYFLCVSRIERQKHLELAIIAATKLGAPLLIVGTTNTPPYERYLRSLAGPTVKFLGFRSDQYIETLYKNSIAFLFPSQSEDFGIAPLEANAHGIPVVAFYGGGAKETVIEGKTGTFFRTHTPDALMQAMIHAQTMHVDPKALYAHAKKFSEERFKQEFMDYVNTAMRSTKTDKSGRSG